MSDTGGMSLLWAVLGAFLITLVGAVCVVYFIVRPRIAKKVQVGAKGLSRELYGRPPLMSGPASLQASDDPDLIRLKGVGVIALTEQAVVFVSGSNEESVIIPRAAITATEPMTRFEALGQTVRRPQPMLVITWNAEPKRAVTRIAFTVADPLKWIAQLAPMLMADDGEPA